MRHLQGICLFVCLIFMTLEASAQQKLVLSTIERSPNGKIGAAVLKVAYQKLGIEIDIYLTSSKRSLVVSSTGGVDGEVLRIGAVARSFPTLLQVDVPIKNLQLAVFRKKSELAEWTVEDLPDLRVGHLAGVVRLENYTKDFSDVWRGHSSKELFEMLHAGKLDVVVGDLVAGNIAIRELGLETLEAMDEPVDQESMFHFLHEKHASLVPEITKVLMEMSQNGELAGIVQSSMSVLEGPEK
jgi:polar amino acid transport system substrate-binding protein